MRVYRAAIVGCSRIGAFIDNELVGYTSIVLPQSHAAAYEACSRTELVAGADLRPDVLEHFGRRYNVPATRQYTDFRELIRREQPDILSVCTQPEQRAEVALFAAEHGVRALYCEKPLCASLAEAAAIVAAVERHSIAFNMGTNRRWHPGFDVMREFIAGGKLGALKTLILYAAGPVFDTCSHWFDLLQRLNDDVPASWVQAYLPRGDEVIAGDEVQEDPAGQGTIAFANGVMAHVLLSPRVGDLEAICEGGTITALGDGLEFQVRRRFPKGRQWQWEEAPPLSFVPASTPVRLIEDLVHALDTGEPTRGGVRVAYANTELICAFVESHRRSGARVLLPLQDNTLHLIRRHRQPREPRYEP